MWSFLFAVRRKRAKVADESMFEEAGNNGFGGERERGQHDSWAGFSVLHSILQAPISSILSCVSHPRVNGSDGVWVSHGEFAQISEMNHLMVSDSMRYAILM